MSTSGICLDDPTDKTRAFDVQPRRPGRLSVAVVLGIAALGTLGIARSRMRDVSPDAPTGIAVSTSGVFPALRAVRQSDHGANLVADLVRHGLAPNPQALGRWAPNTMTAPDICGRLPSAGWSTDAFSEVATRPRIFHTLGLGPIRVAGSAWRPHRRPHVVARTARSKTSTDTLAKLATLLPIDFAAIADAPTLADSLAGAGVHGLGNPAEDRENRRTAALGVAADSLRFDDRPGRLSAAAQAGLWNGAPATAMGVGYTLPDGRIRLDATGVTYVNTLANVGRTFQVSTVASIPLE
jgi:hypothetical protein